MMHTQLNNCKHAVADYERLGSAATAAAVVFVHLYHDDHSVK